MSGHMCLPRLKGWTSWKHRTECESHTSRPVCGLTPVHYSEVYDSILEAGAPGVSTNFGVMADQSGTGEDACNEEWALVYTSLAPSAVNGVMDKVSAQIDSLGIDRYAFYTLPIPRALTYLGG